MYEWLSRLAPHLTGEHTLAELVGPLAAEQCTMVKNLVGVLVDRQFVVDLLADEPHTLDAEEQRIYAAEIDFIRYGLDSAERRFQRLRDARIVLLGSGAVNAAVLEAGLVSGWRDVVVTGTETEADVLADLMRRVRRDEKQSLRIQPWPSDHCVDQADVVLQICSFAERADLVATAQACARFGVALGQVLVAADEAWLTPVGDPEQMRHESCWCRLAAQRGAVSRGNGEWLTGPVPHVIAAQLTLSCFTHLVGLDALPHAEPAAVQPPMLTRVDLRTLVTTRHRVQPLTTAAQANTLTLAAGPDIEVGQLMERAPGFVDQRTGLLGILDEEELSQVPLSVCRATVSDPHGMLQEWAPAPIVTGWGPDRRTARLHTLLAALATYGSLTASSDTELWGIDLVTGRPRRVRTERVYPTPAAPYRAPVGAAAGLRWTDALAAGLAAHCEALLEERAGRSGTIARIEDEQAKDLLRLLETIGWLPQVIDLSDVLGVAAFAIRIDGRPELRSCSLTAGLQRCLLAWQGMPESGTSVTRWAERTDNQAYRALVDALHRAGQVPVAVPIARDRGARELLPYVVQVVLL